MMLLPDGMEREDDVSPDRTEMDAWAGNDSDNEDSDSFKDREYLEGDEGVINSCLEKCSRPDYIMEPDVFNTLPRYFQAGGNPGPVVDRLTSNYIAIAQMCNFVAEWLITLDDNIDDVQQLFERHLQQIIMKNFDPKKADTIFHHQCESQIEWLPELISYPSWRSMIYQLSEQFPECLMLNFAIKLISDAGFQHEISSIATASQQLDIFCRVLSTAVESILREVPETDGYDSAFAELEKVVFYGEHAFVFTDSLLSVVAHRENAGAIKRISQELHLAAVRRGLDTTDLSLTLWNTLFSCDPTVIQAMQSMLSRNSLNAADITLLYNSYRSADPPPVDIIQDMTFMELLLEALFKPSSNLNPDHKPKYIYILAYASSVSSALQDEMDKKEIADELQASEQAITKAQSILMESVGTNDLLLDLNAMFQCLRFAPAAAGVLHWVHAMVTEPDFFKLHPEPVPIHLSLLDEIVSLHPPLHSKVLRLIKYLFECENYGFDVLVQLERRRMLIDRLIHLLSAGYAIPVTRYVQTRLFKQDTDISLIRYFVTETLEIISGPYSAEFIDAFLPIVENPEIAREETLTEDKLNAMKKFLDYTKSGGVG